MTRSNEVGRAQSVGHALHDASQGRLGAEQAWRARVRDSGALCAAVRRFQRGRLRRLRRDRAG
jgi:hypothetical protein